MKRKYALTGLGAAAALGCLALANAQSEPEAPAYIIYDTGTLGGEFAFGAGINNLGWVTGASLNASGALHATLSIPGTVLDLGTLGGMNSAVEWPIKNKARGRGDQGGPRLTQVRSRLNTQNRVRAQLQRSPCAIRAQLLGRKWR